LFGALSFGSAYATLAGDLMPCLIGGGPSRSCLDEVLDAGLRDSFFVEQPEHHRELWPLIREQSDKGGIEVMNAMRKRIGLAAKYLSGARLSLRRDLTSPPKSRRPPAWPRKRPPDRSQIWAVPRIRRLAPAARPVVAPPPTTFAPTRLSL